MLIDIVKKGSTDRSILLRIIDSTDGTPETGVVFNTSGIDLWYRREGAAKTSITEATLSALTDAHSDGGFLHVGDGYYRFDIPDAAFATSANYVDFGGTVTGMVVIGGRVRLVDTDLEVAAMPANVTQFGGSNGTFSGGRPEVNTTHAAGTAWASGAITAASIAADAITAAKIADNAIDAGAIASDAITAAKIADGAIDAATFAAGAINAAAIAADAITAAKIADGAIDAGALAADAITAAKIATGAITAAKFAADAITSTVVADNTITAAKIATDAITAGKIAADAIGASELAADAVTEIQSGLATAASIAALNNLSSAQAQTAAAAALTAYDPPTEAEMNARTLAAASYATAANQATIAGYIDTEVAAIIASIAALNNISTAQVLAQVEAALAATIADSVPADGTRPSISSGIYMLVQFMLERSVSGTTCTVRKPDGSTSLFTLTLDDATSPTSITRA